jgi:hypothetical protein
VLATDDGTASEDPKLAIAACLCDSDWTAEQPSKKKTCNKAALARMYFM